MIYIIFATIQYQILNHQVSFFGFFFPSKFVKKLILKTKNLHYEN